MYIVYVLVALEILSEVNFELWCGLHDAVLLITLSRKRNLFWFPSFTPIKFHSSNQPAKWKMHLILKHNRVPAVFLKLSRFLHLFPRTGCRLNLIHFKFSGGSYFWFWMISVSLRLSNIEWRREEWNPSRLIHHKKVCNLWRRALARVVQEWPQRIKEIIIKQSLLCLTDDVDQEW